LLLLAHADTRLLPLNQNSEKPGPTILCPCQKVLPLDIG